MEFDKIPINKYFLTVKQFIIISVLRKFTDIKKTSKQMMLNSNNKHQK
jgi:hypothetical protein